MPLTESKGNLFGVVLRKRGRNDPHVCIQIISEDDGNRSNVGSWFSSSWIQDLITQLETAQIILDAQYEKNPDGPGYYFPGKER